MSSRMIHHICIQTETYDESLDFYRRILGFEIVNETPNFHGRAFNTWLRLGEFMIELQTPKRGESLRKWSSQNEGIVHMCLLVDDINEEYSKIKSLGYNNFKLKNGQEIYKVVDGYLFKLKAPEGTEVEIRDTQI